MSHCHKPHCQCKQVVHPVKENVVHCYSEETIKHVHPSHTTVMNHNLVKNEHVYPHSTSVKNTHDEVDVYGNMSGPPPNQVGGAMKPGYGKGHQVGGAMKPDCGKGHQVGGAMKPDCGKGHQVGGAMNHYGHPGMGHSHPQPKPGMNPWRRPNRWR